MAEGRGREMRDARCEMGWVIWQGRLGRMCRRRGDLVDWDAWIGDVMCDVLEGGRAQIPNRDSLLRLRCLGLSC